MDVREKLVELIAKAKAMYADDYTDHTEDEYIAETLSDNFITIWDGKPIEEFLHPIDAYKGLKAKYLVFKADTGKRVDNCFILRPDKDAAAVEALRAYAKATDNDTLAKDIYNWVGNGVTVQDVADNNVGCKWVSVKDRLPESGKIVLIYQVNGYVSEGSYSAYDKKWRRFRWGSGYIDATHWMPMPQPLEGE